MVVHFVEKIDSKILKKILKGDQKPLEDLYETYFPEISRFIRFRVKDPGAADDLCGNVFTKTLEYITRENTIENVRAFLYRVARNELALYYRDSKIDLELDNEVEDQAVSEENIEQEIDFAIDWDRVQEVLDALRQDWREIIYLRFIEERSYREIAEITEKSEGAIRVILHRAIQELKRLLEQ